MGLCWWRAGRHGGLRKRRGSWGGDGAMRGDWEIRRRGLRWGGNAGRWQGYGQSTAGRGSCGPGLTPTSREEGTFS